MTVTAKGRKREKRGFGKINYLTELKVAKNELVWPRVIKSKIYFGGGDNSSRCVVICV
jgi:hypothetical protein